MKQATAAAMRRIEELAVQAGDSYAGLMERAGKAAAARIRQLTPEGSAVVLCGKGNNGGDGFVIARALAAVRPVTVILAAGQPVTEDARRAFSLLPGTAAVLEYAGEPYVCHSAVRQAAVLVDCLYGIGFRGALPAGIRPLIEQMGLSAAVKYAIDLPSGVSADSAEAAPGTPAADVTLTMTAEKVGCAAPECGRVEVLDIGIPASIVETVLGQEAPPAPAGAAWITEEYVRQRIRPRPADSHKGTFGRVLLLCGSRGMAGAAMLCARGALRCGAGLVELAIPESLYPILAPALPEAVFLLLSEQEPGVLAPEATRQFLEAAEKASAVVAGCGLGHPERWTELLGALRRRCLCPLVLDADGINAITPHMLLEDTASAPLILTPHPGEMARLLDTSTGAVQKRREEIARRFADSYGVTLALKGHHTLVTAPGQPLWCNPTGNPGMAAGGSGDVLAGMIGSLAAQGLAPLEAAACGVWLHGAAGDAAAARRSQHSMLPSDLVEELGGLFLKFEK